MFRTMFGNCARRGPVGLGGACERRPACKPVDWGRAFAFAGGDGGPGKGGAAPGKMAPFPTFLGALAEALGRAESESRRPVRSEGERKSFRRDVERKLEPLLPTGEIGMDRIARELGCSRQTLYRRLKEEGTTYEQLLDALRRRLALRYIDREGLGVKQAAYRLGFAEPASFSRAFKRWTGRSPSARS